MPRFLPPHLSDVHFPPNLRSLGQFFPGEFSYIQITTFGRYPLGRKYRTPKLFRIPSTWLNHLCSIFCNHQKGFHSLVFLPGMEPFLMVIEDGSKMIQPRNLSPFQIMAKSGLLSSHGCCCWRWHWSGVLPCFVSLGTQRLWAPMKARWLTAREKLMLMGFPVTSNGYKRPRGGSGKRYNYHPEKDWQVEKCDKVAKSYACGILDPYATLDKPHSSVGNSMHIPNCAAVLLTALLPTTPSKSRHPFPCPKKFGSRPPNPNGWRPNTGAILFALGPLGYWNLFVHKEEQILV